MAQPPWKLVITTLGAPSNALHADVYADNWLAALRAGREQVGDPGGVPPGASCVVAESGEVTILDAANRRRYTLTRGSSGPDAVGAQEEVAAALAVAPSSSQASPMQSGAEDARGADPEPAEAASVVHPPAREAPASEASASEASASEASASASAESAAVEPASTTAGDRTSARAQQALPYSPQRADALQREYEQARTRAGVPTPNEHDAERSARASLRAVPKVTSTPGARSSLPPPRLDLLRTPPSTPERPEGTASSRLVPAFSRDVDPTPRSPITYRERAYLLVPPEQREDLEGLLQAELLKLRAELVDCPRGQLVHLAAFDKPFRESPHEPPLATLEWSDWRGNAVFVSHGADAPQRAAPTLEVAGEAAAPASQIAPIPRALEASSPDVAFAATELPPAPAVGLAWEALPDVAAPGASASDLPTGTSAPAMEPPQPAVVHTPPPSAPARRAEAPPSFSTAHRTARELHDDTGEVDGRLATAFEALPDLYFLPTPVAGLEFAIQLISRLVPCEAISACLYDINTDEFRFVAVVGPGASERRASAIPSQVGLFGAAKRSLADALVIPKVSEDRRYEPAVDGRSDLEMLDLAYVPLRRNGQLLGMMQLINSAGDRGFTPADVAVLHYLTNQLSEFVATRRTMAG
ncbi:MAG TPA: GAF domain-containing protein [Polyangiales bacterium]